MPNLNLHFVLDLDRRLSLPTHVADHLTALGMDCDNGFLTPCSLFRPNQACWQAYFAAPKLLPLARPRAAQRPRVVHTDPMGHFN